MEVNATAQCSFGEECGLKTPLCSAFTLPDNQLLCCNAALKRPRLWRAAPCSTTVTLTNALLTQPASLCQRFSRLAKYVGVHTVTRRTYYSVTLITVIYIFFFSVNQNFYCYIDSELLLGKPSENNVCCTCVLGYLHPGLC